MIRLEYPVEMVALSQVMTWKCTCQYESPLWLGRTADFWQGNFDCQKLNLLHAFHWQNPSHFPFMSLKSWCQSPVIPTFPGQTSGMPKRNSELRRDPFGMPKRNSELRRDPFGMHKRISLWLHIDRCRIIWSQWYKYVKR